MEVGVKGRGEGEDEGIMGGLRRTWSNVIVRMEEGQL